MRSPTKRPLAFLRSPLGQLSIRGKMLAAFIALTLLPMLILGLLLAYRTDKIFSERIGREMQIQVVTAAETIRAYLAGASRDVLTLSRFLQRRLKPNMSVAEWQVVKEEFVRTMVAERAYYQVRFLDADGMEVIRVNNEEGRLELVPPPELQYKGDRYYFREALQWPAGEVYVSELDFNQEHGKIEEPRRLVARLATPVPGPDGQVLGIVVINLFGENILDVLEKLRLFADTRTLLLNAKEGFVEMRLNGEQIDFQTGPLEGLEKQLGQALMAGESRDGVILTRDFLVAIAPVRPGGGRTWKLAKVYPRSALFADLDRLHWTFFLLTLPCVLLAAIAAIGVARTFSRPIGCLSLFSEKVARGDFDQRIAVTSGDELGQLAASLNAMAASLAESRDRLLELNRNLQAEVERQLATRAELERSNTELEQFAYVASHDLQEPLRMVTSFVQLLARKYQGKLDEKAGEYIAFAVDGAARMQLLIENLLTYSRVARGAEFTRIEMDEVLTEAVSNLSAAIEEHRAVVTGDTLPEVSGDRTQLLQLLQNLLANAIRYRRPDEPPRVHVSATKDDHRWIIAVRDNGIGIEPQYFDQIFLIFQRLHTREEHPGTGIGLALCKRIVEHHGGRIWVESIPGGGSTFFFTLPAGEKP